MSPQFKDRGWDERFKTMGDLAEQAFREWAGLNGIVVEEYGFRRPPFQYFKYLPSEIRHTPDFICEQLGKRPKLKHLRTPKNRFARHFFVETKGCGRDQIVKIKQAEFETLRRWEAFAQRPILIFVYDDANKRVSTSLTLDRVTALIDEVPTAYFYDDGVRKPYWAIGTDLLEWEIFLPPDAEEVAA